MGTSHVWRVITLGIVVITAAGQLFARNDESATTTPVGFAEPGSEKHERATSNVCRFDPSGHSVRFVNVERGVHLEVLDWGGTGETMVLLTGLGDNAHVFDEFAYQFNDRFHVIGITRRGYGRSAQPAHGYDVVTRARDDIAVLDKLNIREAIFVGHSIAGTEMNELGAFFPDRVKKLVYLDALDLGSGGFATIPQPPPAPDRADDLESVQRLSASDGRDNGFRKPLAALCNAIHLDRAGKVVGAVTPPEIPAMISGGLRPAQFDRIQAPALGILNAITPQYRLPYYPYLDPAGQAAFDRSIMLLSEWITGAIGRFRSGLVQSRVIELHDTNHYVYVVDEALVVREMRKFLLDE